MLRNNSAPDSSLLFSTIFLILYPRSSSDCPVKLLYEDSIPVLYIAKRAPTDVTVLFSWYCSISDFKLFTLSIIGLYNNTPENIASTIIEKMLVFLAFTLCLFSSFQKIKIITNGYIIIPALVPVAEIAMKFAKLIIISSGNLNFVTSVDIAINAYNEIKVIVYAAPVAFGPYANDKVALFSLRMKN